MTARVSGSWWGKTDFADSTPLVESHWHTFRLCFWVVRVIKNNSFYGTYQAYKGEKIIQWTATCPWYSFSSYPLVARPFHLCPYIRSHWPQVILKWVPVIISLNDNFIVNKYKYFNMCFQKTRIHLSSFLNLHVIQITDILDVVVIRGLWTLWDKPEFGTIGPITKWTI